MSAQTGDNSPKLCQTPGCGREHYALGLCWNEYRKLKGYGAGGDRVAANQAYDSTEAGRERHKNAYLKRKAVKKLTGINSITQAFSNPEAVKKLAQNKNSLQNTWHLFTPEQQQLIDSAKDNG